MKECPCRYCKDRKKQCHDNCDKYKKYRETIDNLKKERAKVRGILPNCRINKKSRMW